MLRRDENMGESAYPGIKSKLGLQCFPDHASLSWSFAICPGWILLWDSGETEKGSSRQKRNQYKGGLETPGVRRMGGGLGDRGSKYLNLKQKPGSFHGWSFWDLSMLKMICDCVWFQTRCFSHFSPRPGYFPKGRCLFTLWTTEKKLCDLSIKKWFGGMRNQIENRCGLSGGGPCICLVIIH